MSPKTRESNTTAAWPGRVRRVSMAAIVVSLLAMAQALPSERLVASLSSTVESMGNWGPVVFSVVYIIAALLLVPGSALTLAAGPILGLWWGTLVISLASTIAAGLAFLLGRYVARDTVSRWARRSPNFAAIDRAVGEGGWKVVAMLRLSPVIPFSLGNYMFGLTPIGFGSYMLTSWIAMLPGTFMYVYLGYTGGVGISAAGGGAPAQRGAGQWTLLIVGLLATVVVTVYVAQLARRAVRQQLDHSGPEPAMPSTTSTPQTAARSTSPAGATAWAVAAAVSTALASLALTEKQAVAGWFGPSAVTMRERYPERPDGPVFDHGALDAVLKKYVRPGGRVDYDGLAKDHDNLDRYIRSLAAAPIDSLGRNEHLALLINAYNAFTLRLILDHYPLKSIKDVPASQRWDAKRWNVGGNTWSLAQIENEQLRPDFREPRIHFAIVCGSVGCPPLRAEAYAGERLEGQLSDQALYVHSHDRWFRYDAASGAVQLTSIYRWYSGDFEQVAGSVVDFVARYAPALKRAIDSGRKPSVRWLDYDWSLNSVENGR